MNSDILQKLIAYTQLTPEQKLDLSMADEFKLFKECYDEKLKYNDLEKSTEDYFYAGATIVFRKLITIQNSNLFSDEICSQKLEALQQEIIDYNKNIHCNCPECQAKRAHLTNNN